MNIIPGRKLCCNCRNKIQEMINETEATSSSASEMENVLVEDAKKSFSNVNQSLGEIGESPIKLHSIDSHNKPAITTNQIDEESGSEEDCTEVEEYQELFNTLRAGI